MESYLIYFYPRDRAVSDFSSNAIVDGSATEQTPNLECFDANIFIKKGSVSADSILLRALRPCRLNYISSSILLFEKASVYRIAGSNSGYELARTNAGFGIVELF